MLSELLPICFQIIDFQFSLIELYRVLILTTFSMIAKGLESFKQLNYVASEMDIGKRIYDIWVNGIA